MNLRMSREFILGQIEDTTELECFEENCAMVTMPAQVDLTNVFNTQAVYIMKVNFGG